MRSVPEPYGFIARLGMATGLRWSELVRAQASDVQNGMLVVSRTKSGKVQRVPVPPELLEELRFKVGSLLPIRNSWRFTRQVRRYSGVTRFHPHQMRHTFAHERPEIALRRGRSDAAERELGAELRVNPAKAGARDELRTLRAQSGAW